jgi:hypothetical protein
MTSQWTTRNACYLVAFWLSITPVKATLPEPPTGTNAIPLRLAGRHLLVDGVYIDGAGPFRFVLDTGAQSSSLRTDMAVSLGLRASFRVEAESVGGKRWLPGAIAGKVTLGNHSAVRVEMVIHDLDAMRLVDPRVQGVLGQNYLARFNYLLDVRGRSLSFRDSPGDAAADGERMPFRRVSDRMVLHAGSLDLVLDSGSGDLVLFHDSGVKREAGPLMRVAAVSDAGEVRIGRMPTLRVGEIVLRNVPAAVVPQAVTGSDGLLPVTLFESVFVNNVEGYVILR